MDIGNNKVSGSVSSPVDVKATLLAAYNVVCDAENVVINIADDIRNSLPDKDDPCKVLEHINKMSGYITQLIEMQSNLVSGLTGVLSSAATVPTVDISISKKSKDSSTNEQDEEDIGESSNGKVKQLAVDLQYTIYFATQIVLKKFQIIQFRIERLIVEVRIIIAKITKKSLCAVLDGKGSAENPIIAAQANVLMTTANVVNVIMAALGKLLDLLDTLTILNVNGAEMCFFITPKNLQKTDIVTVNTNVSITNYIPPPVETAISNAEVSIMQNKGIVKASKIAAMGAAGGATALTDFDPGQFGSLPKFNPEQIKTMVNTILQSLLEAEPLPRYEKLNLINIRFLTFLATGFVPAGKRSFGIPGYP